MDLLASSQRCCDYLGHGPQRFQGMAKAKVCAGATKAPREGAGDFASKEPISRAAWRGTFDSGCLVECRMSR